MEENDCMRPPVIDDNPFKKVGEKTIEFDIYYNLLSGKSGENSTGCCSMVAYFLAPLIINPNSSSMLACSGGSVSCHQLRQLIISWRSFN